MVEDPAAMDTLRGRMTALLLLDSNTVAPPVGAVLVSVTVQLDDPPLDDWEDPDSTRIPAPVRLRSALQFWRKRLAMQ